MRPPSPLPGARCPAPTCAGDLGCVCACEVAGVTRAQLLVNATSSANTPVLSALARLLSLSIKGNVLSQRAAIGSGEQGSVDSRCSPPHWLDPGSIKERVALGIPTPNSSPTPTPPRPPAADTAVSGSASGGRSHFIRVDRFYFIELIVDAVFIFLK